jgi:Raf kinase inhibitor-like YbhB/YbcL family protein
MLKIVLWSVAARPDRPGLRHAFRLGASILLVLAVAHGGRAATSDAGRLTVSSDGFAEGAAIPAEFTCSGADASPPLHVAGVPPGAVALALVCDDPDAPGGTWVHWVAYDLPPGTTSLAKAAPKTDSLPGGGKQGQNDFRRTGYNGPCPPPGKEHRYFFRVYALDVATGLPPGATKAQLEAAMNGHVLAQGALQGHFAR